MWGRQIVAGVLALLVLAGSVAGGYAGFLQLDGNFHEVIANELYRSARLGEDELARRIEQYKIRTVINLTGPSNAQWYQHQQRVVHDHKITQIDFTMAADRLLTSERAAELVGILQKAQKPILIHCKRGADRTGLASVIYLSQIAGTSRAFASRQLSFRFGHVGVPVLSATYAMDESWNQLQNLLPKHDDTARGVQSALQNAE